MPVDFDGAGGTAYRHSMHDRSNYLDPDRTAGAQHPGTARADRRLEPEFPTFKTEPARAKMKFRFDEHRLARSIVLPIVRRA